MTITIYAFGALYIAIGILFCFASQKYLPERTFGVLFMSVLLWLPITFVAICYLMISGIYSKIKES